MTPEEKDRHEVIMAGLANWAKTTGKKVPARTGKNADPELLDKLIAAWYAKNKDTIDKEVARRAKDRAKMVPLDTTELDALLASAK